MKSLLPFLSVVRPHALVSLVGLVASLPVWATAPQRPGDWLVSDDGAHAIDIKKIRNQIDE